MGLPEVIARVDVAERAPDGRSPYEIFRSLVLESIDNYQDYNITTGAYYDEHHAFVQEDTGHSEHIHRYNTEEQRTEQLLASIRVEQRFVEKHYIVEIYDRDFAELVNIRFGNVEFLRKDEEPALASR
jgi:hypothetical protein